MNCELMLTYDTPAYMFNVHKNQLSRQTGSRNLMGPKTLPTIWGTYMKLVTKYQISAINSCWEKCNEKCAYMFNVYKNQQSRQTGSRNLTGPKTLPTIWYTYMTLVAKYQISAINSYCEKCDEIYLGRTEGWTEGSGGIINLQLPLKDFLEQDLYYTNVLTWIQAKPPISSFQTSKFQLSFRGLCSVINTYWWWLNKSWGYTHNL